MYDKDNNVFFKGNGSKEWINIDLIDKDLINATISIEDKRFYSHNGFEYTLKTFGGTRYYYDFIITLSANNE